MNQNPQNPHNPLLSPIDQLINYADIKAAHIVPAMDELLSKHKDFVNTLSAKPLPQTWQNFIDPLEYESAVLWRAWNVINHLNAVVNTPELREAYNQVLPKVTEHSTWLGLNKDLYHHYKALKESPEFSQLNSSRQRILELAMRDFKLSGIELEGEEKARYEQISEELAKTSQKFSENALDSVDSWAHYETELSALEGLPQDAIDAAANAAQEEGKTGYKFTLKMPSYLPVMQYAKNGQLRAIMYKGYATIASEQGKPEFDNSRLIEQLLALRVEESQLLGYQDFTQMQLQTRMADSAEQVITFLRDLAARAKPFAIKDVEALKKFAQEQLNLNSLEPWDYAYVSEQLRQARYAYSDEQIKQYLPEDTVMQGFFSIVKTLFNIELEPIDVPTWHKDVKAYTIQETCRSIGMLYLDLYARAGKQSGAWVGSERTRQLHGSQLLTPIVYLTCNFTPPTAEKPALLSPDDLITLFHESGHALHALLSKVDDPSASPFSSVEWDAIELPSQFMENFTWEWPVLQQLTRHWKTNEPLPRELYEKMLAAKNYQSGMQTVRQIEFALFDMLIHQRTDALSIEQVLDILHRVRQEVAVIMPPSWHRFPHNFSHLFAGGYGAGYYSYKWAEVLSADAYSLFEEHSTTQEATLIPRIGQLFKETILAVGGTKPAAEFFKDFRGREPNPEALLRHSGMLETQV